MLGLLLITLSNCLSSVLSCTLHTPSSSSSPFCRLFALYVDTSIDRILLSQHLCTKPNLLFVVLRLAVSSSRCTFVQSGPRLSTNPTLLPFFSMSTPLPFLFTLVSSLPCKPCGTTSDPLCLSPQFLLLVTSDAFRIFVGSPKRNANNSVVTNIVDSPLPQLS